MSLPAPGYYDSGERGSNGVPIMKPIPGYQAPAMAPGFGGGQPMRPQQPYYGMPYDQYMNQMNNGGYGQERVYMGGDMGQMDLGSTSNPNNYWVPGQMPTAGGYGNFGGMPQMVQGGGNGMPSMGGGYQNFGNGFLNEFQAKLSDMFNKYQQQPMGKPTGGKAQYGQPTLEEINKGYNDFFAGEGLTGKAPMGSIQPTAQPQVAVNQQPQVDAQPQFGGNFGKKYAKTGKFGKKGKAAISAAGYDPTQFQSNLSNANAAPDMGYVQSYANGYGQAYPGASTVPISPATSRKY